MSNLKCIEMGFTEGPGPAQVYVRATWSWPVYTHDGRHEGGETEETRVWVYPNVEDASERYRGILAHV